MQHFCTSVFEEALKQAKHDYKIPREFKDDGINFKWQTAYLQEKVYDVLPLQLQLRSKAHRLGKWTHRVESRRQLVPFFSKHPLICGKK